MESSTFGLGPDCLFSITVTADREGPEISGRGPPARPSATKPRKWPCAERPIARVSRCRMTPPSTTRDRRGPVLGRPSRTGRGCVAYSRPRSVAHARKSGSRRARRRRSSRSSSSPATRGSSRSGSSSPSTSGRPCSATTWGSSCPPWAPSSSGTSGERTGCCSRQAFKRWAGQQYS